MKAQSNSCHSVRPRRGFALIATISMLLLLTVIAVAFLSLSTLTVRSSRTDWAIEEARANARLALMIAIGELQRDLGPDRRVSANAAVLDDQPETEQIDGVAEPYWVGVWSTDFKELADASADVVGPWIRNDDTGGLRTRRTAEWDRKDMVMNYLVSGNEGGSRARSSRQFLDAVDDGVENLQEEERLKLVSENSVADENDEVNVKKVPTLRFARRADGRRAASESGSYGYWVGDLNVRANVAVANAHPDARPNANQESGYERNLHLQLHDIGLVDGFDDLSSEDAAKVMSPSQMRLLGVDEDDLRDNFHNITAVSSSVLSNTRDGGLQKDLDAYILLPDAESGIRDLQSTSPPIHYVGLDDDDQLIGVQNDVTSRLIGAEGENRFEETSPRFEIMRQWIRDARNEGFRLARNTIDFRSENKALLPEIDTMMPGRWTVFDGLLGSINTERNPPDISVPRGGATRSGENRPMKIKRLAQPSMAPIVTEASIYYNIAQVERRRTGEDGERENWYQLFLCTYPRVALWNPYNVDMVLPPMIIQLFVNGNKKVEMNFVGGDGGSRTEVVSIPFGKRFGGSDRFDSNGNLTSEQRILDFSGGLGQGFYFLANNFNGASRVIIPPGQTIVFSPDPNGSKRARGGGRPGDYSSSDFVNNLLTPRRRPSEDRFFWEEIVKGAHNGGVGVTGNGFVRNRELDVLRAISYTETATGQDSGADNAQFMLKYLDELPTGRNSIGEFSERWKLMTYANTSLQIGGSDELPLRLASSPGLVHTATASGGGITLNLQSGGGDDDLTPRFWTRDGYRLRWFDENPSNLRRTRRLSADDSEKLFQTAPVANWNMRMTFSSRNPLDNITDQAPYFYGIYTRDLPSTRLGFDEIAPTASGGLQQGFPFGLPSENDNNRSVVLFEMPTERIGIPSLAYLRNLKLSELAWHPTYPVANSLADPKIFPEMTTIDRSRSPFDDRMGPFNTKTIGFSPGRDSGRGEDYWANLLRETLQFTPVESHVVYDMSFETNYKLWDTYFMSTGDRNAKTRFADDQVSNPLPNGRLRAYGDQGSLQDSLTGDESFFRAASQLMLEGGFNVHSTSREAWVAVLGSSRGAGNDSNSIVFPRFLNPNSAEEAKAGVAIDDEVLYTGNRVLDEDEIERLAEEMVVEVKRRAPFLGLADFVNRRLYEISDGGSVDEEILEQARAGAIEEAIGKSGINDSLITDADAIIDREDGDLGNNPFDNIEDPTRLNQTLKPPSKLWGMPGYLTQGDVLGVIGSGLRARSDTFVVRAYGDSKSANGKILARAWCEATVQRTPEPVNPDSFGLNPEVTNDDVVDFGRRFKVVGFRWLGQGEV